MNDTLMQTRRPRIKQVVNLSWQDPAWNWLAHAFTHQHWVHHTSRLTKLPSWLPKQATWARLAAAWRAVGATRQSSSVLVSHGPIPATYGALLLRLFNPGTPHLIYAFNFTDLPQGLKRRVMSLAFRQADRMAVFSTLERELYAKHFALPESRFDMIHWAAHPLALDATAPALVDGDYICAIGSQGRDYPTLLRAMQSLPNIKLVLVAHPENMAGCQVPDNVKVYTSIPLLQVSNILAHSRFMVLPLRDSEVPCGHVTIVSAFHQGKAVIVTDSRGVHDYVQDHVTGRLVPPADAQAMADCIQAQWHNTEDTRQLALAGQAFGARHCTEAAAVQYFQQFMGTFQS